MKKRHSFASAERSARFLVVLLCILSATTDHGEEQEMGLGERFVRGSMAHYIEGTTSPISRLAKGVRAFFHSFDEGSGGLNQGRPPHQ